jgi:hypothetical protein
MLRAVIPYRRITSLCLIVAPVLFLIANVLHPKEYRRNHEVQQLREIGDHYTRWQAVHFMTFISILLFVFAVVGLAWLVMRRREVHGALGGALGLVGLVSIAAVLALDGFTWGVVGEVSTFPASDQHTMVVVLHGIQQAHWNLPFYVGALSWLIGLVILSVGLIREQLVPPWAGWTFAAGAVLVGIEAAVENNAYFIIAAAVLAVGGVGVGTAIGRLPDEEFRMTPMPAGPPPA